MFLSGEELNNDGLRHNKHMTNEWILLGWTLEGRVVQATGNHHFFYFANPSRSNLSLNTPIKFIATPPPHPIQIIYDPVHSHSNYYIWFLTNQSLTSPFWVTLLSVTFDLLLLRVQNDEKWSRDWWNIVGRSIWALTAQKPCLYIIKQSFLMVSPSVFALLWKVNISCFLFRHARKKSGTVCMNNINHFDFMSSLWTYDIQRVFIALIQLYLHFLALMERPFNTIGGGEAGKFGEFDFCLDQGVFFFKTSSANDTLSRSPSYSSNSRSRTTICSPNLPIFFWISWPPRG